MRYTAFSGDDWEIPIVLKKNNVVFDVSTATEIKALVSDGNNKNPQILVAEVVCSNIAPGADWANGKVVAEFDAADTANITSRVAYLEVQVEMNSKKFTWPRAEFDIKKGLIA